MACVFSKLKRAAGLLSLISMMVSSVAACACSHHSGPDLKSESKESCHTHSEQASEQEQTHAGYQNGPAVSSTMCSCPQVSPRLVFKQDQKQLQISVAAVRRSLPDIALVDGIDEPVVDNFDPPSFTQSFLRDSIADRAPPRPNFT